MQPTRLWGVHRTNPQGPFEQSFVIRQGSLYVMDNHRAALWCWLRALDVQKQYNLLHIDRHYDTLGDTPQHWNEALGGRRLEDLTLEEYLTAEANFELAGPLPVFRYDNYLSALRYFHPRLLNRIYFATHDGGSRPEWEHVEYLRCDEIAGNIQYLLSEESLFHSRDGWIMNIDVDYFFYPDASESSRRLFSDVYIEHLFEEIKMQLDKGNVRVITVATSPSNTGGWNKARDCCSQICGILGFPNVTDCIPRE